MNQPSIPPAVPPETSSLLQIMFTSMGEGACFVDAEDRFTFANPAAERIFAAPSGGLVGRSLLEFLQPDQVAFIRAATHPQGESNGYEHAIRHTDGSQRWLLVTVTPHFGPDGAYLGAVAVFRDITSRKRIEAVQTFLAEQSWLATGEEFFRALVRYLAIHLDMDAVGIVRLVDQGQAAQTLAIYYDGEFQENLTLLLKDTPALQVLGKTIQVFPRNACDLFPYDPLLQAMQAEAYLGATLWNSRAEPIGLIGMASRNSLPAGHAASLILQMAAGRAAREMERAQAEAALRFSEARYRLLAENTSDVIWAVDNDLRFTYISPSILRLRGLTQEEALQETIPQTLTPDSLVTVIEVSQQMLANEIAGHRDTVEQFEVEQYRKDGSTVWVEIVIQPTRDDQGHKTGYLGVSRDISARKQAEQVLRRYAAEQELLFAVTSVASAYLNQGELLPRVLETLVGRLHPALAWITLDTHPPDLASSREISPELSQMLLAYNQDCLSCMNSSDVEFNDACLAQLMHEAQFLAEVGLTPGPPLSDWEASPTIAPSGTIASAPRADTVSVLLHAGDQALGRLCLVWGNQSSLAENARATWATIGRQISIALHNAQLYQSARQADRLQSINQISAAITSSLDPQQVLQSILQSLGQATGASAASVLRLIPETGEMVFEATLPHESAILVGRSIPTGAGLAGWIVQNQQSLLVADVQHDPRYFRTYEDLTGVVVRSLVGAPLLHQGQAKGVIQLVHTERSVFSNNDLALLEAVASIAAVALENARLFTAARSRADELATIHQISQALSASLDSAAIIDITLRQLYLLLSADFAGYFPIDPHTGQVFLDRMLHIHARAFTGSFNVPPNSLADWIVQTGRSLLIPCAAEDVRMQPWIEKYPQIAPGSLLFAPLLQPDAETGDPSRLVIGCLCVCRFQPNPYSPDELRILESTASVLNVALKNAELYEDLQTALDGYERTQNQLIQTEKVAALGRLAASLAHEINNPLQAVKGYISLIHEDIEACCSSQLDEYLHIVRSEIERMAALVRDIRELYRPSSLSVQAVDTGIILQQVLALASKQLVADEIVVESRLDPLLPRLMVNPDHLKQIFLNLILNAIEAMPGGGTLHIMAETPPPIPGRKDGLDPQAFQPAGDGRPIQRPTMLSIQFTDSGHGISPENMEHIFEPFYTTKETGSGLGLYICYTIVESYGGSLSAASPATTNPTSIATTAANNKPGPGSTITVTLPVFQEGF